MAIKEEYINKIDSSKNSKYKLINENTKIIVVGTITPKEIPFYYCSSNIYKYIDDALEINEFVAIKKSILNNSKREKIQDMINLLNKYNIAFVDVFEKVIRTNNNSHEDKDIIYATIEYNHFKPIKNTKALILCNSHLAEDVYKVISTKLNLKNECRYYPLPRASKQSWIDEFKRLKR